MFLMFIIHSQFVERLVSDIIKLYHLIIGLFPHPWSNFMIQFLILIFSHLCYRITVSGNSFFPNCDCNFTWCLSTLSVKVFALVTDGLCSIAKDYIKGGTFSLRQD